MPDSSHNDIAVIGIGCRYPGADGPKTLWENVLARRRAFRRLPDVRLPPRDYFHPDPATPDTTYSDRAAVIDGFRFDWAEHRIPKSTFESTDIAHWLALDTALHAIDHAGLAPKSLPRDTTGVIVGNSLTGEQWRASIMRLRWPVIRRALSAAAGEQGWQPGPLQQLLHRAEEHFKSLFRPFDEDTLAGYLSNTIAGRICGYLDLRGGGYTVDGACASSLLAVIHAAERLAAGDLDFALAGGVDVSLDTFELIGFAKTRALSPDEARVYDAAARGFLPGEGCGLLVLQRYEDAERSGHRILARLRGWGVASDGKAGITNPTVDGQALALRRAYARARLHPCEMDFIEGHGTGTPVGDRTELSAMASIRSEIETGEQRPCGVTSLKSLVGHTKAAAGVGGLIKAILAVSHRVLPPTCGIESPSPVFGETATGLYPLIRAEAREPGTIMRAGVSAMGFGGINTHVVIESASPPDPRLEPDLPEHSLSAHAQRTELIALGANDRAGLQRALARLAERADGCSLAELADLSAHVLQELPPSPSARAMIVSETPEQLVELCQELRRALESSSTRVSFRAAGDVAGFELTPPVRAQRIAFVFPGQGSQMLDATRRWVDRFEDLTELVRSADGWLDRRDSPPLTELLFPHTRSIVDEPVRAGQMADLTRTENAQPAIVLTGLIWMRILGRFGIRPDCVAGHSLGEVTALCAAGILDEQEALTIAQERGRAMASSARRSGGSGGMISLRCSPSRADEAVEGFAGRLVVANRNAPQQTIISGDVEALEELTRTLREQGVDTKRLNVDEAFHSPRMALAEKLLRESCSDLAGPRALKIPVLSTDAGRVLEGALSPLDYLAGRICAPVDFCGVARELHQRADIVLEVGSGRVLSGLLDASATPPTSARALPLESRANDDRDWHRALGELYLRGVAWDPSALHARRLIRPFVPARDRIFIENPCEGELVLEDGQPLDLFAQVGPSEVSTPTSQTNGAETRHNGVNNPLSMLRSVLALKTGWDPASLSPGLRLLDDLNLDSIKATEVVALSAQRLGIGTDVSIPQPGRMSIGEIAAALAAGTPKGQRSKGDAARPTHEPTVQDLSLDWIPTPSIEPPRGYWRGRRVAVLGESEAIADLTSGLREAGALLQISEPKAPPPHWIVIVEDSGEEATTLKALEGSIRRLWNAVRSLPGDLHRGSIVEWVRITSSPESPGSLDAFTASWHAEVAAWCTRSVSVEKGSSAKSILDALALEAEQPGAFRRSRLFCDGRRETATLELASPEDRASVEALDDGDRIWVTGGAKGITAECALAWGRASGAHLVLSGRSPASDVSATLERFQAAGVRADYLPCDVTRHDEVERCATLIRDRFGPITAVLHGAGANRPCVLNDSSPEAALDEVAPKLLGMENLLRVLSGRGLRRFIALSSVIGVTGMPGNAWYAFSNELVDARLRQLREREPAIAFQSYAYSVWGEVGMGVELGVLSALAGRGIDAIPPRVGVEHFERWLTREAPIPVVVTGRWGDLASVPLVEYEPSIELERAFLETIVSETPWVELTARTRLHFERDPYLEDHRFRGSTLFPTVFGLEAMAQATARLLRLGSLPPLRIEDIDLGRALVVDTEDGLEIELTARVVPGGSAPRVQVAIRSERTDFRLAHFAATFVLEPPRRASIELPDLTDTHPNTAYDSGLLFQGHRFQRIREVAAPARDEVVCRIRQTGAQPWLLGDPYARDALLQTAQLVLEPEPCLPVRVARWTPRLGALDVDDATSRTRVDRGPAREHDCEVTLIDDEGNVLELIEGYIVRRLERETERSDLLPEIRPEEEPHPFQLIRKT